MLHKFALVLLAFLSVKSYSQINDVSQHTFTYRLTYQIDSTNSRQKSEDMLLLIGKDVSLFESYKKHVRDSLLTEIGDKPIESLNSLNLSQFPKTAFNYKIIKNYLNDDITTYDKIFTDPFEYNEQKIKNWSIKPDILVINGLKCQKATTTFGGRSYEAWFTNEIPISDGPYKFSGLPGLIVKIADTKGHYTFELIDQSTNKHQISDQFLDIEPISIDKKTFFNKLQDYRKNSINRIAEMGFSIDDEFKKGVKDRIKSKNNPIELSYD